MTDMDDWWQQLVGALDDWSSAEVRDAGGVDVLVPRDGGPTRAVVVMTPDDWDDMVSIYWGCSFDAALAEVKRVLLSLLSDERYAVYSQYRLEPSTTPTLPRLADNLPEGGGEWSVRDRHGRVVSRLRDFPDEHS